MAGVCCSNSTAPLDHCRLIFLFVSLLTGLSGMRRASSSSVRGSLVRPEPSDFSTQHRFSFSGIVVRHNAGTRERPIIAFRMQHYTEYDSGPAASAPSVSRDGAVSSTLRNTSRPRSSSRASSRMAASRTTASPTLRDRPSSGAISQGVAISERGRQAHRSSDTWTSSSGDLGILSDTDDIDDRADFIQEYNRLAQKVGLRCGWKYQSTS
jgi:hypothetical protein